MKVLLLCVDKFRNTGESGNLNGRAKKKTKIENPDDKNDIDTMDIPNDKEKLQHPMVIKFYNSNHKIYFWTQKVCR